MGGGWKTSPWVEDVARPARPPLAVPCPPPQAPAPPLLAPHPAPSGPAPPHNTCRSCGICKDVLRELAEAAADCRRQRAGAVFLAHDMHDAWDTPTDVARFYALRAAPRFLFFVEVGVLVGGGDAWGAGRCLGGRCGAWLSPARCLLPPPCTWDSDRRRPASVCCGAARCGCGAGRAGAQRRHGGQPPAGGHQPGRGGAGAARRAPQATFHAVGAARPQCAGGPAVAVVLARMWLPSPPLYQYHVKSLSAGCTTPTPCTTPMRRVRSRPLVYHPLLITLPMVGCPPGP